MTFQVLDQESGLPSPNTKPMRKKAVVQIIDMQQSAYEMATNPKLKEALRCFAMRSFCSLQEERRKLEMRPLPKPVDVDKIPGRRRHAKPVSDMEELPPATTGGVQPGSAKP